MVWRSTVFIRKWFYYYAIASNFIFRFFWTVTLSGTPVYVGIDSTTMGWIAATVEIVRYSLR